MFCSQCGTKAAGNFCSGCGTRLPASVVAVVDSVSPAVEPLDWQQDANFENIVRVEVVRTAIALNVSNAVKGISAEAIFAIYDKLLASPIPLERLAAVMQPLYASWGIRTGKERIEVLEAPIGRAIAQCLCSFAKNGQAFLNATHIEGGCLLVAELPSSLCSLKGKLQVTLSGQSARTRVEAATLIPGQVYDWGKSSRCLDRFFSDLHSDLGLQPRLRQQAA